MAGKITKISETYHDEIGNDEITFYVTVENTGTTKKFYYIDLSNQYGDFIDRFPNVGLSRAISPGYESSLNMTSKLEGWSVKDVVGQIVKFDLREASPGWLGIMPVTGFKTIQTVARNLAQLVDKDAGKPWLHEITESEYARIITEAAKYAIDTAKRPLETWLEWQARMLAAIAAAAEYVGDIDLPSLPDIPWPTIPTPPEEVAPSDPGIWDPGTPVVPVTPTPVTPVDDEEEADIPTEFIYGAALLLAIILMAGRK